MSVVVVGRVAVSVALASVLLAGCARFDDSASGPFSTEPTLPPAQIGPDKRQPQGKQERPTGPCIDPDAAVVSTCLDTTGGVVSLADTALVTERRTGRILKAVPVPEGEPQAPAIEIAKVDVDGSADGGLSDIAISPNYADDGLIYAYITTATDNRVVRIAEGGPPKDILTGIPKGPIGNHGALDWISPTQLMVLTGDAGNPAAAATPSSLAGKLLRLNSPATGQNTQPEIAVSGIGVAGDICRDGKDGMWITDRTAAADRLQRISADGAVSTAWTWPDHPGVAGCAGTPTGVAVALTGMKALALATADPATLAVTSAPILLAQDKYGQLAGAAAGPGGLVWAATVNKTDGQPGPNDDRLVVIPTQGGGNGSGGPD